MRGLAGSEASGASEVANNLPPNVPEWMKTPGDPMGAQPYGAPSPFEKGVIKNIPNNLSQYLSASGRTPLQDLDGIITRSTALAGAALPCCAGSFAMNHIAPAGGNGRAAKPLLKRISAEVLDLAN
jgi:hypothetical protein